MKPIVLLLMGLAVFLAPEGYALEAGAAKVDITAPVGTPLNGYGDRMGRASTSVHDPIWSRALYLDDGETQLYLVSADLVAINPELRDRVMALAGALAPPERIILTATHTHNGQGGMIRSVPLRFVSGRFMPEVLESTARGIVQSMENAYGKRQRAALGYAVGKQKGLSVNRRYPDGPIDEQIGVIMVEDADGNPISVVTNFAAHPTSVGGKEKYAFSADYPGFYYLEMETLLGEGCVPIFLNGALGNQTIATAPGTSGWDRTEAVGRQLARQAAAIAESITFGEVALRVTHIHASLPRTLSGFFQIEATPLYALEINDLHVAFFPGEPCVELGLEMRRRALDRGYEAQMAVGLANDYAMYFVPRHLYPDLTYESSSTLFGPGIEDWFYDHFEAMMSRMPAEDSEPAAPVEEEPQLETLEGAVLIDLEGGPYAMGLARGNAFVADIQLRYAARVTAPVESGAWLPESGMLRWIPPFMDRTALALPLLGMGARPMLKGLSLDLIREMEGMAEGARIPFDALWLLQHAPLIDGLENKASLYAAPLCTMFAVVGERAGKDILLVGRNLDWLDPEEAVITRVRPDTGHAFIQAGFSWNAGVYTAMNDAGLTLCIERVRKNATRLPDKGTIEFIARDILQRAATFSEALKLLEAATHVEGVHVLLAGFDEERPRAAVVEFNGLPHARYGENGLLLGVLPEAPYTDAQTRSRYERLVETLADLAEISVDNAQTALTESDDSGATGLSRIWSEHTRHSVVFLPKSRETFISFPSEDGRAGAYNTITFTGVNNDE